MRRIRAFATAVAAAACFPIASGAAHAALPTPNCDELTATTGQPTAVAPPGQYAVDIVFTNTASELALQALGQQIGFKAGVVSALQRLSRDPAPRPPARGAAARDRDLATTAAAIGSACGGGLPRTAAEMAIAEGVTATDSLPAECGDVVDVKQSKLDPKYATAAVVVDPCLFGVAYNFQGGDQLVHLGGSGARASWFVVSSGTDRPCAVKRAPQAVLRELYGNRC